MVWRKLYAKFTMQTQPCHNLNRHMKKLLLLIILVYASTFSFAQTATIRGITVDTINKQNLPNTAVMLLRTKDSVLVKFARSNDKGAFELKNLKAGNYILFATYPQYADYAENITLAETSVINMGA